MAGWSGWRRVSSPRSRRPRLQIAAASVPQPEEARIVREMREIVTSLTARGRAAFLAGRMPKRLYANASSPLGDLIGGHKAQVHQQVNEIVVFFSHVERVRSNAISKPATHY